MVAEEDQKPNVGTIVWTDLTVPDADKIRDFYARVVGWNYQGVPMGDYEDYVMSAPRSAQGVAGVCYKRGPNANVPTCWLIYVAVNNVNDCVRACVELGGKVIDGPRSMGTDKFCVIQDPAGAYLALIGG